MNRTEVFAGKTEMHRRMQAYDWAASPLGPVEVWPESLKTAIRIVLTSRYAMWMAWGPELTFFYNDTYGYETLGVKHGWALGRPTREVWREIWPDIGGRIEHVLVTGEATWDEGLRLFLERSGFREETFHTFSYSPLFSDAGEIAGMLCVVTEETERILNERQLTSLRRLATTLASALTQQQVLESASESLSQDAEDLPFTLVYVHDESDGSLRLVSRSRLVEGEAVAPERVAQGDASSPWSVIGSVLEGGQPVRIALDESFGPLPEGVDAQRLQNALLVPLAGQGAKEFTGVLVAGLNPCRPWTQAYSGYLELIAGQISAGLAKAEALEQERRRAEALAEIDRAKTTFFSNVSHELRTPLTLMLAPLEDQLRDPQLDPARRSSLELVHRNSMRLLKLVNTLLEFSRVEAGRVRASFQPVDLAAFTSDLASMFRSAVERAGLEFVVACEPLAEPVYVDPEMWEKIVLNLLSNALKSTFTGAIRVTLRRVGQEVQFSVADTGTGIPASEVPHLFERFRRVEGAARRSHEGTGIGLALVQELIRMHGGEIAVDTELGKGTTFSVTLRLGTAHLSANRVVNPHTSAVALASGSRADAAMAYVQEAMSWLGEHPADDILPYLPAQDERVSSITQSAEHLLLVDDNPDMRSYLSQMLGRYWRVSVAANGEEALTVALRDRPDLILSDVMMPVMDGFALLAEVRRNPDLVGIPMLLLSARAGEESRLEGVEAGADDYITKPFTARELLTRVRSQLELSRVRRGAAQAERELREIATAERNRLQDLFLQAPAAIAILSGPNHIFRLVNQRYIELADRASSEDFLGKTVEQAIPEVAGQGYMELLDQCYRTGERFLGEESRFEIVRRGRREALYMNFVYQPWRNSSSGDVEGIFIHVVDVTAQVLARKEVEELAASVQASESRLSAILQQVVSGVCQVSLDGRFLFHNDRFCAIAGCSERHHMPTTMEELVHPEDLERSRERFLRLVHTGDTYEEVLRLLHPDGTEIWVQNNWSAVLDSNGQPSSAVCVTQDITERKQAEEALRRSEKLAAVGQMASTIAHEINNPLEAVTNLLYLIQGGGSEADISNYAKLAGEELQRVSHVVTQTLQFHRGGERADMEQLGKLVDSALGLYRARLRNANIEVRRRMREHRDVFCSGGELRQVFANMIGNSFDATRSQPVRRLALHVADATLWSTGEAGVRVTIADTGHGMDEETRRHIFEPFFTTKGNNGSGLGLWLSMDILHKHQCVLSVRTCKRPGRSGTVFSMFFPAGSAIEDSPVLEAQAPGPEANSVLQ